jgi:23S rRNA (guanine745-N1)-methyltransferase
VLADVLRFLICPHCGAPLASADGSVRCRTGHSFDVARQGYVSLLPAAGPVAAGDTAEMVRARHGFLAAGHFSQLATALARLAASASRPAARDACVADVGAGPGYYLAAVLDELPGRAGLALDASKFALRAAARAHQRIGAVRCDIWHGLPVASGSADVLLNVFAPRNGAEFARILAPAGLLLVVTPTDAHLRELVGALGLLTVDIRKEQRLARTLEPHFVRTEQREVFRAAELSRQDALAAVLMGPSAWRSDPAACASLISGLPEPVSVTLSVTLSCYRRRAT